MLRALFLALVFFGLPTEPFAQVCCPSGCVQDGASCIRTGPAPAVSCPRVACSPPPAPTPTPGGGHSTGTPLLVPFVPYPGTPICCDASRRPGGSYSKTCRDYEMRCTARNELLATCKDRRGRDVRTALPNVSTCKNIENENGQMKCRYRTQKIPPACG